jgi:hypothetical protein
LFEFVEGETLETLNLTGSKYGYGSFRQINFITSKGRNFSAGSSNFTSFLDPPVQGAYIVGFDAWVNVDGFINAFAIDATFGDPSSF